MPGIFCLYPPRFLKTWISHILEAIRASSWTLPSLYVVLALCAASFGLWVDAHYTYEAEGWTNFVRISSPDTALTILSTVATSVLALAGVSFSSILVTMTLASQQFGPRLLRNFMKDRVGQGTLGVLIATFIYCMYVMRRIDPDADQIQVPQVATVIALFLALVCLGSFIRFIHHILIEIQSESVVLDAYRNLEQTINAVFPAARSESDPQDTPDRKYDVTRSGWGISLRREGYVQAIDVDELVAVAKKAGAIIRINERAGRYITERSSVVNVIEGPSIDNCDDEFIEGVRAAFFIGNLRTPEQDYEYGFRQLVEVALRALSPGINDPFTAMDCLDYIRAGIEETFSRPLPPTIFRDEEGAVRVLKRGTGYPDLLDASLNQIRQAAVDRCDVSCKLLEILAAISRVAKRRDQQLALQKQGQLIVDDTVPRLNNDYDRMQIIARHERLSRLVEDGLALADGEAFSQPEEQG